MGHERYYALLLSFLEEGGAGQHLTNSPKATLYLTPYNPFLNYTNIHTYLNVQIYNMRTHTHTISHTHTHIHTTAEDEHTQEMSPVVNKMLIAQLTGVFCQVCEPPELPGHYW